MSFTLTSTDAPSLARNTYLAAAVSVLGVMPQPARRTSTDTERAETSWDFPLHHEGQPIARDIQRYLDGKLETDHQIHDGMRAMKAYESIMRMIHRGERWDLIVDPTTTQPRWLYVNERQTLVTLTNLTTSDLALAAALSILGNPVMGVSGTEGNHTLHIGQPISTETQTFNGLTLATAHRAKTLDPGHPLCWAIQTIRNYHRIKAALGESRHQLHFDDRNANALGRYAILDATAKGSAYDDANKFFHRPRTIR
jgi:hypothetical protein